MILPTLAAVLSQRVVLRGRKKIKKKKKRGNIRRAYNKCIFYVSLLLT